MIGYYAHHQGAGHVTRLRSIAPHLGVPVWGLSSREPPAGWGPRWTVLARDDQPAPEPSQDVTAGGVLHWAPTLHPGLADRTAQIASWVAEHRPRLLVVDVSVEVALLARLCGVPTVVVALPGTRLDRPHRLAYDSATALLAPWPSGAHEQDWPQAWRDKLRCVGGLSRFDGRAIPARPTDDGPAADGPGAHHPGTGMTTDGPRRVLLLWGRGGRSVGAREVVAARAATPGWTWTERHPVTSPSTDLWADLAEADVVVCHGGQNVVAEVAAARRPAVVVAQPRPFDEQEATAQAVDRLGVAVGLPRWPETHQWPALLDRALARGGERWLDWSSGDGAARAARALTELAASEATTGVA